MLPIFGMTGKRYLDLPIDRFEIFDGLCRILLLNDEYDVGKDGTVSLSLK